MLRRLYCVESRGTDPYENLGLEETLLHFVEPEDCILYLWQNRRTVVVGRNQNVWQECNVESLRKDGGFVTRRLSGGGAVYHDLGNLNFTFLLHGDHYDVKKQLSVLEKAVQSFGIPAEQSGRNDLLANGRKFSGNAFYKTGTRAYHHGTVMISVDSSVLSKYLNVSLLKLRSKGVESVQARVCNLEDFVPGITVQDCKAAIVKAFGEVYGLPVEALAPERLDQAALAANREKTVSWDWIYGRSIPFDREWRERYPWGELQVRVHVNNGAVKEAVCYSDSVEPAVIERIEAALSGVRYEPAALREAVLTAGADTVSEEEIRRDAAALVGGTI